MLTPLAQALILLAGSVFLVTLVRRLALPTSLAYLLVGLVLGPHALGVVSDSGTTRLLAELGVAFLLFTLGLEFSFPRMLAMRREVFGLGALQVVATTAVFAAIANLLGIGWLTAIVLGGAIAMSSTALLLQQLTERAEINRTHGRLAFAMLLFQDLAFVPFFALGAMLAAGREDRFQLAAACVASSAASLALVAVLARGAGCCGRCFTRSRTAGCGSCSRSPCYWWCWPRPAYPTWPDCRSHSARFSSAMMLAETEYRYQIDR